MATIIAAEEEVVANATTNATTNNTTTNTHDNNQNNSSSCGSGSDAADDNRSKVVRMLSALGLDELLARDLEIGIFNWTLQQSDRLKIGKSYANPRFVAIYVSKARSVLSNLDADTYIGNTTLLPRVLDGSLLPHEVPFLKPQDMFPERWKEVVELKVQKDEYAATVKPVAMTHQFKCRNCKNYECVYQEVQLRSADEASSIIVTCISCGNTWRVGG
jgi:DNA-directed RNA polymerase subunit M/transcription elongation factor TFIIS